MISCIKILYDFFKNFVEFSIAMIYFVFLFNFFLSNDNAKNSTKFSLKSHFNFIVSLLIFFVVFLIFFNNSTFVIYRNFVFSTSFSICNVSFFSSLLCSLSLFFYRVFFFVFNFCYFRCRFHHVWVCFRFNRLINILFFDC